MINNSTSINDLRTPSGNKLELLKGDKKGLHSIRINDQWRICFRWKKGHTNNVKIIDYYKG